MSLSYHVSLLFYFSIGDFDDGSKGRSVAMLHDMECEEAENISTSSIALVEGGPGENIISLVIWNDCVGQVDYISSPLMASDLERVCDVSSCIPVKYSILANRSSRIFKYESVNSIMGVGVPVQAKGSINDSNIKKRIMLLLEKAAEVVKDCSDLNLAFLDHEDEVMSLVVRILQKQ